MANSRRRNSQGQYLATHSRAKTSEWNIWLSMRQRCSNKKFKYYKDYGGRGIAVCERWESFENFYKDMGERPEGMTLDRQDNSKGYSPENCKWATRKEQSNNTRRNRFFTIDGVTKTLAQWTDTVDVKRSTISQRYYVYGWSIEKALGLKEGG